MKLPKAKANQFESAIKWYLSFERAIEIMSNAQPVSPNTAWHTRDGEVIAEINENFIEGNYPYEWCEHGGNIFRVPKSFPKIAPGYYEPINTDSGIALLPQRIQNDKLLRLKDDITDTLLRGIEKFWASKHLYDEMNFVWKRGVFLYGPPGGGKTSTVHLLAQKVIDVGGIVLIGSRPFLITQGLRMIRHIEPDLPAVVILEDMDAIVSQDGEAHLLSLLDGENQFNNVVFIATTNYPEKLDKRITNRPSRFDEIHKINMPSVGSREQYLDFIYPEWREDSEIWITKTEGFSIAHLKELVILLKVFEIPLEEGINRMTAMIGAVPSSGEFVKNGDSGGNFL